MPEVIANRVRIEEVAWERGQWREREVGGGQMSVWLLLIFLLPGNISEDIFILVGLQGSCNITIY